MTDTWNFPKDMGVMSWADKPAATVTREDHHEIKYSKSPDAEAHMFTVTFEDGDTYKITAELLIRPNFGFTKEKQGWIFDSVEWVDPTEKRDFFEPWYGNDTKDVATGVYFEARQIKANKDTYQPRNN